MCRKKSAVARHRAARRLRLCLPSEYFRRFPFRLDHRYLFARRPRSCLPSEYLRRFPVRIGRLCPFVHRYQSCLLPDYFRRSPVRLDRRYLIGRQLRLPSDHFRRSPIRLDRRHPISHLPVPRHPSSLRTQELRRCRSFHPSHPRSFPRSRSCYSNHRFHRNHRPRSRRQCYQLDLCFRPYQRRCYANCRRRRPRYRQRRCSAFQRSTFSMTDVRFPSTHSSALARTCALCSGCRLTNWSKKRRLGALRNFTSVDLPHPSHRGGLMLPKAACAET